VAVNPTRYQSEIRQLKKSLSSECDCIARSNIAGTYRMAGNRRRAFEWWQRAAAMQVILSGRTVSDGSAFLELGYCYQYGTGVRRDERAARTAYRSAVRSQWINEYSREEALYHLAVAYLDLDSAQPLCFTLASAARTVTQATPELLELSQEILNLVGNN
jgi:TPR repeat protein